MYTYYVRGSWGPSMHVQAPSGDPGLNAAVIEEKSNNDGFSRTASVLLRYTVAIPPSQ
jgi:hypothetical protein